MRIQMRLDSGRQPSPENIPSDEHVDNLSSLRQKQDHYLVVIDGQRPRRLPPTRNLSPSLRHAVFSWRYDVVNARASRLTTLPSHNPAQAPEPSRLTPSRGSPSTVWSAFRGDYRLTHSALAGNVIPHLIHGAADLPWGSKITRCLPK